MNILVIGASGKVGSEVVRLLKAEGVNVREATAQKEKVDGEQKVFVNLATGEGLKSAFTGIDKAFLLSPPPFADHHAILSPMIQEAKRHGLRKVVLMTALGANALETTPFRKAEIELEKSGLNWNIVRPNWFMQNFTTLWAEGIQQGKIALPAGDAKTSFIDSRDISAVVAKLLLTDKFDNQAFDITGPEGLTHADVAGIVSEVTGKKVVYENLDPQILLQGFLKGGVPRDYAEFLILIFGFLAAGYNARSTDNVKLITGKAPRDFRDFVEEFKQAWI